MTVDMLSQGVQSYFDRSKGALDQLFDGGSWSRRKK